MKATELSTAVRSQLGSERRPCIVPTIAIITNVIPSYREGFFNRLFSRDDIIVDVYCQQSIPGMNIRTIHDNYPGHVTVVKAISARGEAVAWQFIPWSKLF